MLYQLLIHPIQMLLHVFSYSVGVFILDGVKE
jgi:hypothetical protein